jgi:hypothetical protein
VQEILIDAVVHAVNKDYPGMAGDFIKLGFLAKGEAAVLLSPRSAAPDQRRRAWDLGGWHP